MNTPNPFECGDDERRGVIDVPATSGDPHQVDELRIIDASTFALAQGIRAERARVMPALQRRKRHLLAGLLRCAVCGGNMVVKDWRDGGRLICGRSKYSTDCDHRNTHMLQPIEARVLASLRKHLTDTRRIELFAEEYRAERRRLASAEAAQTARRERRLGEIERELKRFLDAFGKGAMPLEIAGARITELQAEKQRLEAERADEQPNTLELHPGAIRRYRDLINGLRPGQVEGIGAEAAEAFRRLVSHINIGPKDGPEPKIEIAGWLVALTGPEDAWG